jgi:hypothetical protein
MNFMIQTRRRRFTLYALTIVAGILVSCVILGGIGYNSNQNLELDPQTADSLGTLDKGRLAEALQLKAQLGNQVWPGFADLEAPIILWNDAYEFLVGVSNPPSGWEAVPDDQLAGEAYFRRPAVDPQNFAVRVGDQWAASIFTKPLVDSSLIFAIRDLLPPLIADIFPYRLIIQPSELQIAAVQHEYFHVFQAVEAAVKFNAAEAAYDADDRYWAADEQMRDAWQGEVELLVQAVETTSQAEAIELTREFLDQRAQRRQDTRLEADLVAYERQFEWLEGTAKYVELRSWEVAFEDRGYLPSPELQADEDFKGYDTFEAHWNREISQARRQAGVDGEVRFYYTGMLQAYLLDRLMPDWQARIMDEGVYLEDLLQEAISQ